MQADIDRNPYHHIPPESRKRAEAWAASARNLVSQSLPYRNLAVERLMFAEQPILQMEDRLAHREGATSVPDEPLLLMECSSLSILWALGLYEVTRLMKPSHNPKWALIANLHKKLPRCACPWPNMKSKANLAYLTIRLLSGNPKPARSAGACTTLTLIPLRYTTGLGWRTSSFSSRAS
jgi:hypothetical protein